MGIEEDIPLWKRVFLNELVWAFVAGVVILYFAFSLATSRRDAEDPRPDPKEHRKKS